MNSRVILFVIFAMVAGVVLLVQLLVLFFRRRGATPPSAEEHEPGLVERAAALEPPADWSGRVDRGFDRMIHNTMFGLTTEQAAALVLLCGVCLAAGAFFVWEDWLLSGLVLLVGMAVPVLIFWVFQSRWRRAIQEQLPDGCFLLARSLRAGLSLEQALETVATYSPQPLAGVFRRCGEQVEMGMSASAALERTAETVRLADFDALASVLILHRTSGGNLPAMLDRLAASIRDRNQFRGYFRTATALSALTGVFIAVAAPVAALANAILHPDMFAYFFRTSYGVMTLGVAILLEIVGVIWLAWLLRPPEY
jgi:tight adherence protein B